MENPSRWSSWRVFFVLSEKLTVINNRQLFPLFEEEKPIIQRF